MYFAVPFFNGCFEVGGVQEPGLRLQHLLAQFFQFSMARLGLSASSGHFQIPAKIVVQEGAFVGHAESEGGDDPQLDIFGGGHAFSPQLAASRAMAC